MKRGPRRRPAPWLPIGAVAAVVLVTVLSRVPHLGTGELDFDEGVYWLSLRSLRAGHALATEVYSSQPPAFLLGLEPAWVWLGGTIEAARALMTVWACVAVVAAAFAGWRLAGRWVGVAAGVLVAVDPRLVAQSVTLQADGPATALGLAALAAAAVSVTARGHRAGIAAAALAGGLLVVGILTKLFDVGLVPAIAVALLLDGRWRARVVAAAAGVVVAAMVVLLPLHGAWGAMWNQAVTLHLDTRNLGTGLSWSYLHEVATSEWPVVVLAAAGSLSGWWAARRLWLVALTWCAGAMLALAFTRPLFAHHDVLLTSGMVLLAATAVASLARAGRSVVQPHAHRGAALAATASGAVAAIAVLVSALAPLHAATDLATVRQLDVYVPPAALVLSDDQFDVASAHRDSPPPSIDTSKEVLFRGGVTPAALEAALDADSRTCAVLLQSGRLSSLPGFVAWAAAAYPEHHVLDGGAVLDIRPGCPS